MRERFGLDARTITGDEEARLTFLRRDERAAAPASPSPWSSSTSAAARPSSSSGAGGDLDFHVSTQAGVGAPDRAPPARDPPAPAELEALRAEVARDLDGRGARRGARRASRRHRRRRHADVARRDRPASSSPTTPRASTATASRCDGLRGDPRALAAHAARASAARSRACTPTARPRSSPARRILVEAMRRVRPRRDRGLRARHPARRRAACAARARRCRHCTQSPIDLGDARRHVTQSVTAIWTYVRLASADAGRILARRRVTGVVPNGAVRCPAS